LNFAGFERLANTICLYY